MVSAAGGETRWLEIPGDPRENYIVRMDWVPESEDLVVQQLNRRQNTLDVFACRRRDRARSAPSSPTATRPGSTSTTTCKWFDHGRAFTWTADRDGWRRLEVRRPRESGPPLRLYHAATST